PASSASSAVCSTTRLRASRSSTASLRCQPGRAAELSRPGPLKQKSARAQPSCLAPFAPHSLRRPREGGDPVSQGICCDAQAHLRILRLLGPRLRGDDSNGCRAGTKATDAVQRTTKSLLPVVRSGIATLTLIE